MSRPIFMMIIHPDNLQAWTWKVLTQSTRKWGKVIQSSFKDNYTVWTLKIGGSVPYPICRDMVSGVWCLVSGWIKTEYTVHPAFSWLVSISPLVPEINMTIILAMTACVHQNFTTSRRFNIYYLPYKLYHFGKFLIFYYLVLSSTIKI